MKKTVLTSLVVISALALSATVSAAGFRENKAWQFDTPSQKIVKLQYEQTRLLNAGGYFRGSHAARYYSIGSVSIDSASVSIGSVQSSQNIANWSDIDVRGDDNYLNVGQDLTGQQTGENSSVLN